MQATIDDYITRYISERRARSEIEPSTVEDIRSRLHSLAKSYGNRPVNQLGPHAIEVWLESIGHMRPASRRAYLSTVKGFCRWLARRGYIRHDPTEDAARVREPRSVPRALNPGQVATLLESRPDLRSQAVLWLMVELGLRCCEVARLRVEDYDPNGLTLFIVGKGSHERILPVPALLARVLDRYIASTGVSSGPLIRSELDPHQGITSKALSRMIVEWFWAAGLKHRRYDGLSAHALRHTCLSDVADRCNDLRIVQAVGGHANLATASVYQRRMDMGRMREAVEGRDYRHAF